MSDFLEVDFLGVETDKSGDAIAIRYVWDNASYVHVVDGGYRDTGPALVQHINQHYGAPALIDHVVLSHPDRDHAGGLTAVLENFRVRNLWMLRPWLYAAELLPRFERVSSVENLRRRLREAYPYVAELEAMATAKNVPIREPFHGARIGAFTVLSPAKSFYLDLLVESEKTPMSSEEAKRSEAEGLIELFYKAAQQAKALLKAAWGLEVFSPNDTSVENEMSVVQFAHIDGETTVLTADAGRRALAAAVAYAPLAGLRLPGVDRIQIPHHGSRRNVSTEVLDAWLGPRLPARPEATKFTAVVSSAKKDEDHPRKAVVRAFIHRGAKVVATEGKTIRSFTRNAPERAGWNPVTPLGYPEEQETA